MRIESFPAPPGDWATFTRWVDGADLGHELPWGTIFRDAYALESRYLVAKRDGGDWGGVLAATVVHGLGGGRDLVSLPYLDTGGILARDAESEQALLEAAGRTARSLGCRGAQLRQTRTLGGRSPEPAQRVAMSLEVGSEEDAVWCSLPGNVRNQTRKARRSGLSAETGGAELLDAFYAVHRVRMRELGSPVHARRFFASVGSGFGERLRVCIARDGAEPVGGLIAIQHGDAVTVPWASTLSRHNHRCPNNLIYWEALRFAVQCGARRFEFGRSAPGGGTWRFKRGWGASARPLPWVQLDTAGRVSAARLPTSSRALTALSRVWRSLPGPLCDRIGPRVRPRIAS